MGHFILRKAPSFVQKRLFTVSHLSASASGFRINADRLAETLHHTCQWGAAHRYGEFVTPILRFFQVSDKLTSKTAVQQRQAWRALPSPMMTPK